MEKNTIERGIVRNCEIRLVEILQSRSRGGYIMAWLEGSSIFCYLPSHIYRQMPASVKYNRDRIKEFLTGMTCDIRITHDCRYTTTGKRYERWSGEIIKLHGVPFATFDVVEPYEMGERNRG